MMSTSPAARSDTGNRQRTFERDLREHLARKQQDRCRAGSPVPNVESVRRGLSLSALDEVREQLGLSQDVVEGALGVTSRTLQRRRKRGGDLTPAESDRLWRIFHTWHRAVEAFGNTDSARTWLKEPKAVLGGETPMRHLDTEPGLREVEDMLTVIDETAAA